MSGRRWLLRAFPRSWRARFGDQLGHLLDDMEQESGKIRAGDRLDVARAGLVERLRELGRHRRALLGTGVALSVAAAAALSALSFASVPSSQTVSPPPPVSSTTHPSVSRPTVSVLTTAIQTAKKSAAAQAAAQQAAVEAQAAAQAAQTARIQAAAQAAAEAAAQAPSQAAEANGTAQ
jgi:hypothetical protein